MAAGSSLDFSNLIATLIKAPLQQQSNDPNRFGGYLEEIFSDITKEEIETHRCGICMLIIREPKQCSNGHLFCSSCVTAWLTCHQANLISSCPVCRVHGSFEPNLTIGSSLAKRSVICPQENCSWHGHLAAFISHIDSCHPGISSEMFAKLCSEEDKQTRGAETPDVREELVRESPFTFISSSSSSSVHGRTASHLPQSSRSAIEQRRRNIHTLFQMCRGQLQRYQNDVQHHYQFIRSRHRETQEEAEELERRLMTVSGKMMQLLSLNKHHISEDLIDVRNQRRHRDSGPISNSAPNINT